jgi:hypothetical protein
MAGNSALSPKSYSNLFGTKNPFAQVLARVRRKTKLKFGSGSLCAFLNKIRARVRRTMQIRGTLRKSLKSIPRQETIVFGHV